MQYVDGLDVPCGEMTSLPAGERPEGSLRKTAALLQFCALCGLEWLKRVSGLRNFIGPEAQAAPPER